MPQDLFGHDPIASVFQDGGRHDGQRCDEPSLRNPIGKPMAEGMMRFVQIILWMPLAVCFGWMLVLTPQEFTDGKLTSVVHKISGDAVVIDPNEQLVSDKWAPIDWHSDLAAGYQYKGSQPFKLCEQFPKSPPQGPWKIGFFSGVKQKAFVDVVTQQAAAFIDKKNKLHGGEDQEDIKTAVQAMRNEKGEARMKKAREAAIQGLDKQKELRKAQAKPKAKAKAQGDVAGGNGEENVQPDAAAEEVVAEKKGKGKSKKGAVATEA